MVSGQEATDSAGGDVPQLYEGAGRSPSQVHRGAERGVERGVKVEAANRRTAKGHALKGTPVHAKSRTPSGHSASLNDSWLPSAQMACILNLFGSC